MVAPLLDKKSEKKNCGSGSCYRKKDNMVVLTENVRDEDEEAFKEEEALKEFMGSPFV